jgi:hypothetical protein
MVRIATLYHCIIFSYESLQKINARRLYTGEDRPGRMLLVRGAKVNRSHPILFAVVPTNDDAEVMNKPSSCGDLVARVTPPETAKNNGATPSKF